MNSKYSPFTVTESEGTAPFVRESQVKTKDTRHVRWGKGAGFPEAELQKTPAQLPIIPDRYNDCPI